jgi:hypothetical protein
VVEKEDSLIGMDLERSGHGVTDILRPRSHGDTEEKP